MGSKRMHGLPGRAISSDVALPCARRCPHDLEISGPACAKGTCISIQPALDWRTLDVRVSEVCKSFLDRAIREAVLLCAPLSLSAEVGACSAEEAE